MKEVILHNLDGVDGVAGDLINSSIQDFSKYLLELLKQAPVPGITDEIQNIKQELEEVNKMSPIIMDDKKPSKAEMIAELRGKLTEASKKFIRDEGLRAFKKQITYFMERCTDLLLATRPEHYHSKIKILDQALRQLEVMCSPKGQADPSVEHVDGVSLKGADPAAATVQDFSCAVGRLHLGKTKDGKKVAEFKPVEDE